MLNRRGFLTGSAGGLLCLGGGLLPLRAFAEGLGPVAGPSDLPAGTRETAVLEALSGKKALIKRSVRPPNYETPLSYFASDLTDNDAFFVRYHLSFIPEVSARDWKLSIGGDAAERTLSFSLADLQKDFEQVELCALCQCAGNRRGVFAPHVPGVQWGYGAMGNAVWRGVRLKDVLHKAGVKKQAVEVSFDGADSPVAPGTPDFIKSLPMAKALDENTLIAWQMNGKPLPRWNGFPARLVVPGWAATYWMKHLNTVRVLDKPLQSFWMKTGYRVPKGKFPGDDQFPTQTGEMNTPITEMVVNSLITNLDDGQTVMRKHPLEVVGVAWDRGDGIKQVEVSVDGGKSWHKARLGPDHGRFSWQRFTYRFTPTHPGPLTVMTNAQSKRGEKQATELVQNPAGYHHNVIQKLALTVQG